MFIHIQVYFKRNPDHKGGSCAFFTFKVQYQSRTFWRLEGGAYADFADAALTGDVLPYNNYPGEIETGQVFAIEMIRSDTGASEWFYYRSDGTTWNGLPTTVGFDPEA